MPTTQADPHACPECGEVNCDLYWACSQCGASGHDGFHACQGVPGDDGGETP